MIIGYGYRPCTSTSVKYRTVFLGVLKRLKIALNIQENWEHCSTLSLGLLSVLVCLQMQVYLLSLEALLLVKLPLDLPLEALRSSGNVLSNSLCIASP